MSRLEFECENCGCTKYFDCEGSGTNEYGDFSDYWCDDCGQLTRMYDNEDN